MPERRLVVVGVGPERRRLHKLASASTRFVGEVADAHLRWLYANSSALVSAAYEDHGLTPLEGASFGKPAIVFRGGGFLETVLEGRTGVFFDEPTPAAIRDAALELGRREWDAQFITAHAADYSERSFVERLRSILQDDRRYVRSAMSRSPHVEVGGESMPPSEPARA